MSYLYDQRMKARSALDTEPWDWSEATVETGAMLKA